MPYWGNGVTTEEEWNGNQEIVEETGPDDDTGDTESDEGEE